MAFRFGRLVSQTENLDTEFVKKAHDQCNQYLHAQKDPAPTVDDPRWVQDFKDFLTETADKLLS